MTDPNPALALVERFVDAIERGDLDALQATFAPHARIWHNTDQIWATKDDNAAGASHFFTAFIRRKYNISRLEPLSNGAILQFIAAIERADGKTIDWPGCVVFEIEDGAIVQLMEYIDLHSFLAVMD